MNYIIKFSEQGTKINYSRHLVAKERNTSYYAFYISDEFVLISKLFFVSI